MSAHILIAGGGIAGLATALALARRRHRIDLLEQSVGVRRSRRGNPARPQRHAASAGARCLGRSGARCGAARCVGRPQRDERRRDRAHAARQRDAAQLCGALSLHPSRRLSRVDARRGARNGAVTLTTGARVTRWWRAGNSSAHRAPNTRLGGRCTHRRRWTVEHRASLRGGRHHAAPCDRPHRMARTGQSIGIACIASQYADLRLARTAPACRGLSGAPGRGAQRGCPRRVGPGR